MSMISPEIEIAFNVAATDANSRRHEYITLEHLLYALLHDDNTVRIIEFCGGGSEEIKNGLHKFLSDQIAPLPEGTEINPEPTLAFQRTIQRAAIHIQSSERDNRITGGDIIVALFSEPDSHAVYFLEQAGISRFDVVNYLAHGISKTEDTDIESFEDEKEDFKPLKEGVKPSKSPLDTFTVDLVKKASEGLIDPIIGREIELTRTVQTLCRRRKNNPLLVGEPGVGKTAIAEGLALKIYEGDVPEVLRDAELYLLDMGALLAGTRYRGDFEQRLKGVVNALKKKRNAILLIDEIHTIIGGGATSGGSMDAANLLKPSLASGELKCIGSTTYSECRNYFEKDRALARRFQKIEVDEPTIEQTVKILKGLRPHYEKHHGVKFTLPALRAAVELSAKYINERKLPDKAIDVIDEVGASMRIRPASKRKSVIGVNEIESVVAKIARIPARSVSSGDRSQLESLERDLKFQVFGQDQAIQALSGAIKLSRAGLSHPEKPVGSFLFTGPTGVGKTEVAKQLASIMGVKFLRFDMSEYSERHTVSRLIGAPPGYVGFDQGGLLTEAINQNPYSVLLLDEIEKAHPDLFNILLQIMDHATLTDNNGKKSDFRNVILIMTSNVGARDLLKGNIGFGKKGDSSVRDNEQAIKNAFSPEFRNRLDGTIAFGQLNLKIMERIVDKFVVELESQLSDKKVCLHLTSEARRWLAKKGHDPVYGARPLGRLISEKIKQALAEEILFGKLEKGGDVNIGLKGEKMTFSFKPLKR
jgi:ATP-dependent Clp protease ATP-binding subunit ClpA